MNEEQIVAIPDTTEIDRLVEALDRIAKAVENLAHTAPAASGVRKPSLIDIIEGGEE